MMCFGSNTNTGSGSTMPNVQQLQGLLANVQEATKRPKFIVEAVKAKCGNDDIFVIGLTETNLAAFSRNISRKPIYISEDVEEVGRVLIDINFKSHENTDKRESAPAEHMEGDSAPSQRPKDWYDEFKIESSQNKDRKKSFKVSYGTSETKEWGFGAEGKLSGGYFNLLGGAVGLSGHYSHSETETTNTEESEIEGLSKGYRLTDVIKVAPRTSIRAEIKTYAITFKLRTTTEFHVAENVVLTIPYRVRWQRLLGGICTSSCCLTAAEVFCNETNFRIEDGIVKFQRDGEISYIGEEVKIKKYV